MKFSELVRLLEQNGFKLIREKERFDTLLRQTWGDIFADLRHYAKPGVDRLIRVDYHGAKEIPTGTCNAILKAAGLKGK
jgi:predicted RNA binding protein YcfA (HicA-like mRNA interferase family)